MACLLLLRHTKKQDPLGVRHPSDHIILLRRKLIGHTPLQQRGIWLKKHLVLARVREGLPIRQLGPCLALQAHPVSKVAAGEVQPNDLRGLRDTTLRQHIPSLIRSIPSMPRTLCSPLDIPARCRDQRLAPGRHCIASTAPLYLGHPGV